MYLPDNTILHGGTYRIIRAINSGNFGCTYEAEHIMLEKKVAIKEFFVKDFCTRDTSSSQIRIEASSKKALVEKLRKTFIDEAKTLYKLHHPGIVSISDVFEENGTAYFVMDYIEGRSLENIVEQQGALNEATALDYIRQVAEALKYAHSHNCLHLDINPGNILIDHSGKAILIDFGAARQYDEADGENTSALLDKTPGYAPLEQMGNDVIAFTPATDIYALGSTLYNILTGVTPPSSSLLASGEELEPLPTTLSENTKKAVEASMRILKKKRPQSIDDFLAMLGNNSKPGLSAQNTSTQATTTVSTPGNQTEPYKSENKNVAPKDTNKVVCSTDQLSAGSTVKPTASKKTEKPVAESDDLMKTRPMAPRKQNTPLSQTSKANESAQSHPTCPMFQKPETDVIPESADKFSNNSDINGNGGKEQSKSGGSSSVTRIAWIINSIAIILLAILGFMRLAGNNKAEVKEDANVPVQTTRELPNVTDQQYNLSNGITYIYTGPICAEDNLPSGRGVGRYTIKDSNGNAAEGVYEGEYVKGLREGEGKYSAFGGKNKFEGTFQQDQYHSGTLTLEDGSYYIGTFKRGNCDTGKWYFSDGSFDCEMKNGEYI